MTPEQQRITIAEFLGWTDIEPCTCHNGQTRGFQPIKGAHKKHTPDYLNDLNAMHEAEKLLSDKQELLFVKLLNIYHPTSDLFSADSDCRGYETQLCREAFGLLTATAAQRAEALLRTIGKWEETK